MMENGLDARELREWEALEKLEKIVVDNDYFKYSDIWRLKELGMMFLKTKEVQS